MQKAFLRLRAVAAFALLIPSVADAAGLGKLTVTSALGQPLSAQIELVSVSREELNSLAARLAAPQAYRDANLQFHPALNSLRFTVEQRPGAQPVIRVTSTRPINEPVVDLLVELAWANGRISRAYTVLIDPPGYEPQRSATTEPAPAIETRPVTPPAVEAQPQPSTPIRSAPARAQAAAPGEYGPIKRGETLAGIAGSVKPEGVTLEQMLVGLYRSNPDAFVNNMNRMKTGRILRVPEKEQLAAITPSEARQEVRVQARDWNAYRQRIAEEAAIAREGSATSGRITARVEDENAQSASRDVVRLSKGEVAGAPGGRGGQASAAERLRAMEEEAVARDKALAEANERIAELEKTIREQQRLLALKAAPLGTQTPAGKPAAEAAPPAAETPKPAAEAPAAKPPAPAPQAPAAEPAAKPAAPTAPPAPKSDAQPKPKPSAAPPAAERSFVDELLDEPLYLAAAGGILVLAGLGYVLARRRRPTARPAALDEVTAPTIGPAPLAAVTAPPVEDASGAKPAVAEAAPSDELDAVAEAEVYIAYGRDGQAEEILKEALAKNPARYDVQLKLLEIYAARKDRAAFKEVATRLNQQTGGQGEVWNKAAAMGRAVDESDALYAAAALAVAAGAAAAAKPAHEALLDLEIGTPPHMGEPAIGEPAPQAMAFPEVSLPKAEPVAEGEPAAEPAAMTPAPAAPAQEVPPLEPDFALEVPPAAADATPSPAVADSNLIDFTLELPKVEPSVTEAAAPAAAPSDSGLDFKLDFGDIDLNVEGQEPPAAAAGERDPHWHDVQQKFDLAKAYEEMGDKEGAREVLQEVLGEGDDEQQAQAKKLLEALA